jgi:helicase MOV-10
MPSRPSKAVPIRNPADGTHIVIQPNAEPYDREWPPIANPPAPNPTPPAPAPSKPESDPPPRKDSSSLKSTLDVYARAYVPEAFSIINEFTPSFTYEAPNPRAVDYVGYVQSFGATPYLQNRPYFESTRHTCLDRTTAFFETKEFLQYESELSLSEQYERHFECLIGREFAHHRVEHERHSLYNEKLQPYPKSKDLYSLEWPGVREETPFIQAGDSIQLRQLTPLDESLRLASMERWIKVVGRPHLNSARLAPPSPLPPGWTGSSYTARVHIVRRAVETVVLYAPHLSGNLEFNVILPVPKKPYETRLNAVAHFRRALENGIPNGTSQAQSDKPWARKILFPEPDDGVWQTKLDPWTSNRKWFDGQLNFEQQKAVISVCKRNYGTVPFIIPGPPGTGKTKTIVEMALQLIQLPSSSHILICASSEGAADTLADRLSHHLGVDELFRLNAPTRNIIEVPSQLHKYCCVVDYGFILPDFRRLMGFKVVVTSCQDSSLLVEARVTNMDIAQFERGVVTAIHPTALQPPWTLHWGALLLDEAAQAVEPEAVIPLSVISPPADCPIEAQPLFVMAGDECQLGPRTYSHHPRLKASLFARLCKRPLYADHPLSRRSRPALNRNMLPMIRPPFTNLCRNYRSHPAILAVPSYAFYADTLLTYGRATDALEPLPLWRGRRWPVLFVSNPSDDDVDKDGGGWFNPGEARKAASIAKQALSSGLIDEADVCIMSPFAAQVRLLRRLCRDAGLGRVNIGPCEAFQGLESRFVVLCTTRARERFLDRDVAVCKGIVRQPQRMNVCLTRAREGLVVVGNPKLLSVDPDWLRFMGFCKRNGLIEGEIGELEGVREEEALRLESVLLARDRDADFDAAGLARQLGVYTDNDMLWAQGLIAEDVVRRNEDELAGEVTER